MWDARTGDPITLVIPVGVAGPRFFGPDSRKLYQGHRDELFCWELTPEDASIADLQNLAKALSGVRLDPVTGSALLSSREIGAAWNAWSKKRP